MRCGTTGAPRRAPRRNREPGDSMRRWLIVGAWLAAAAASVPAAAQQFTPPPQSGAPAGDGSRLQLGLYGFGVRTGVAFSGGGQLVLGTALDLGNLFSPRVRLRP